MDTGGRFDKLHRGSWIIYRDLLGNLSLGDKQKFLREIGKFILHILEDMCDVQGERESRNQDAASIYPAVMPSELVKMPSV